MCQTHHGQSFGPHAEHTAVRKHFMGIHCSIRQLTPWKANQSLKPENTSEPSRYIQQGEVEILKVLKLETDDGQETRVRYKQRVEISGHVKVKQITGHR